MMKNSWFCLFVAGSQLAICFLDLASALTTFAVGVGFILVSQICSSIESLQKDIREMRCNCCDCDE